MYGIHSIEYSNLDSHLYVFGIRDTVRDIWLSWDEVEFYAKMLDLPTVPVLFKSDENFSCEESFIYNKVLDLVSKSSMLSNDAKFVTSKRRSSNKNKKEFPNDMFFNSMFKWVRKGHVTTDEHWSRNWSRAKLSHEF